MRISGITFYTIPRWVQRIIPGIRCYVPQQKNTLYLTFDDGPVPGITDWVLDELREHQARATFFCLGKNIERSPDLYRRIVEEGHDVGNHTYGHLNGWQTSTPEYLEQVERCMQVHKACLPDRNLRWFRPPYGRMTIRQYRQVRQQYQPVYWDVLSGDYEAGTSAEEVAARVIRQARPGSIVVFHDSVKALPRLQKALPLVLSHFTKQGWQMAALSQGLSCS